MKKLILILLLLVPVQQSFAQLNALNQQGELFSVGIGANKMFYNNKYFNQWTASHYNFVEKYSTGFAIDLSYTNKRIGGGLLLGWSAPFENVLGYFGYKLTGQYSKISSWLNVQVGEVSAKFKDLMPVHYQLNADEIGQKMELHYNAGFIGLSSKNYLNSLHWNIKMGKDKIPVNVGFYASTGFTPIGRNWRYGYYSYKDSDTSFVGRKVTTVPKLSKVYGNTGVFIAF